MNLIPASILTHDVSFLCVYFLAIMNQSELGVVIFFCPVFVLLPPQYHWQNVSCPTELVKIIVVQYPLFCPMAVYFKAPSLIKDIIAPSFKSISYTVRCQSSREWTVALPLQSQTWPSIYRYDHCQWYNVFQSGLITTFGTDASWLSGLINLEGICIRGEHLCWSSLIS